jgi:hypothetical protein
LHFSSLFLNLEAMIVSGRPSSLKAAAKSEDLSRFLEDPVLKPLLEEVCLF